MRGQTILEHPYIYINTDSIFSIKQLEPSKLLLLPEAKSIEHAKSIARDHYDKHKGRAPLCGRYIEHYIYHDGEGSLYEIGLDNKVKQLFVSKEFK